MRQPLVNPCTYFDKLILEIYSIGIAIAPVTISPVAMSPVAISPVPFHLLPLPCHQSPSLSVVPKVTCQPLFGLCRIVQRCQSPRHTQHLDTSATGFRAAQLPGSLLQTDSPPTAVILHQLTGAAPAGFDCLCLGARHHLMLHHDPPLVATVTPLYPYRRHHLQGNCVHLAR
jgi:hypothetical protein